MRSGLLGKRGEIGQGVYQRRQRPGPTGLGVVSSEADFLVNDLGIPDPEGVVIGEQIHGQKIFLVTGGGNWVVQGVDGLVSERRGIIIGARTRDCLPILFFSPSLSVVGALHGGWRGLVNGIIMAAIEPIAKKARMRDDWLVFIGPGIGPCCYELSLAPDDRLKKFVDIFGSNVVRAEGKKKYLDLKYAAAESWRRLGVKSDNIEVSKICTACGRGLTDPEKRLPSYYRDGQTGWEELLSVIALR